ncbi:MAG: M48 family metallopeptidase [Alistipes indistinctus]
MCGCWHATRNRSSNLPTRPAAIRCGSIRAPAAGSAPASAKGLSKFGIRWSPLRSRRSTGCDPQGIEQAWRTEAQADLPQRTARLAGQLGFRCGAVTVRNARTRWGSCSARDDISLSIHLMKLPDELIDYVIIHELCHTIHKNHGPKFHKLLDRLTGGHHLELRRRLKTYSTRW